MHPLEPPNSHAQQFVTDATSRMGGAETQQPVAAPSRNRAASANGAAMLNLNGITVRLGGRVILDGATAALPPGSRVGLIGRNGAGKSTMVRVIAGLLEPDDGSADMPKGARIGYIAQEAPAGEMTPFDTVLAADTERAALMHESETTEDTDRLGDVYERLIAIDAYTAPARAAQILLGLGSMRTCSNNRSTVSRAGGRCASRSPRCCSRNPICCCSTNRRTISISKR